MIEIPDIELYPFSAIYGSQPHAHADISVAFHDEMLSVEHGL